MQKYAPSLFIVVCSLIVTCALPCSGVAGVGSLPPHVSLAPDPDWADPLPVVVDKNLATNEMIKDGVQHLLVDNQVRLSQTNATYFHYAFRFQTEAGIRENASVEIAYDPSFQSVVFHRLRLLRGAQIVNCLKEGAFRVLQRENNLEMQLLDGRTTLLAVIEDVRINDVLEYAYTVVGGNPVFEGRYSGTFVSQWSVPLARQRLRVLVPEDRKLYRQLSQKSIPEPAECLRQGVREWLWDQTNSPPVHLEGEAPVWYKPMPEIVLSEYASWAEVAHWAASCFRVTNSVDQTIVPQLAVWRKLESEGARAAAALDFVQNEIRYFGLELGAGSHRPNPPALVLQRRFGDCKDKAALLCALLGNLGIEAYPALVNVFTRAHAPEELPSPLAFNHAIAVARIEGKLLWMDPTRTNQRGPLQKRYLPPYGKALVVDAKTTELQTMAADNFSNSRTEVHEQFDLQDMKGVAALTVRSRFYGRDAEQCRERFANNSRTDWERYLLNYYAQRFADVEQSKAVTVEDDAERNMIATAEHYTIRNIWQSDPAETNSMKVTFNAQELETYVKQPATVLRKTPLGLPYPMEIKQTIEVLLPEEWGVNLVHETLQDPYFCFTSTSSYSNKVLTLHYQLQTKSNSVPLAKVAEHLKLRREIAQSLDYYISKDVSAKPVLGFNWSLATLLFLWCGLLGVLWIVGYRYAPQPPPLAALPEGQSVPSLYGVGGWLVLPCIGLVGSLFIVLSGLIQLRFCFDLNAWQTLTTPGNSAYHALWSPTLYLELLGNSYQLALITLCGVLLVRHRASFPRFMILLYVSSMLMVCVDNALALQIPEVAAKSKTGQMAGDVNRTIVACCIWIPYFLTSRRVRNTFRK
jgi:transglutaminase-like putative cysteine protease